MRSTPGQGLTCPSACFCKEEVDWRADYYYYSIELNWARIGSAGLGLDVSI